MILFFRKPTATIYAVQAAHSLSSDDIQKLTWLFSGAIFDENETISGTLVGPRREMVTPWSTNAVEITQTMGIKGIIRIEEFIEVADEKAKHDPMLQRIYNGLDQDIFTIVHEPDPIIEIDNLKQYNEKEGLALSQEEIDYLEQVSDQLGRKLTDSEVFGFSQVNSEHCRHKIFNGTFVIDGKEMTETLFQLIKEKIKNVGSKISMEYRYYDEKVQNMDKKYELELADLKVQQTEEEQKVIADYANLPQEKLLQRVEDIRDTYQSLKQMMLQEKEQALYIMETNHKQHMREFVNNFESMSDVKIVWNADTFRYEVIRT